jgi:hypothetical protein
MVMGRVAVSTLVSRARGKAKRVALRAPVVKQWSDTRYFAGRGRHSANLPWLSRDRQELVTELRRNGLARGDATTLLPDEVIASAERFANGLRQQSSQQSVFKLRPEELAYDLTLFTWGLTPEILDLAEYYLGLPVHYLGVEVKRERADGVVTGARQWHIDVEDRSAVKILIYLSDVDDGCGPFEYLQLEQTQIAAQSLRYVSGYVAPAIMNGVVPEADRRTVTGPRLTAIFVDTCRVFHRAQPPTTTERYSMTFAYASERPYQRHVEYVLPREALLSIEAELTARQRRAARID